MTGLQFHFEAFNVGMNAPTQVQILANDLMVERSAAFAMSEGITSVLSALGFLNPGLHLMQTLYIF